jgi:pilus assembly protein CpaB
VQLLSSRRLKFLSVAALLSGVSVVLTQQWLHQAVHKASVEASARAAPTGPLPAAQVLVAATALPAGTILKPGQARWQAWPAGTSTAGYLTQANTRLDQMTGAVVRASVDAGEPLTANRLVQPGDRSFLAAVLQPGYRAVTVNVTASTGLAGLAMPGDHVDVILNIAAPRPENGNQVGSVTVLQDLRLLAMDQRADATKDPKDVKKDAAVPQTATLEVTPRGAEIVGAAEQMGTLSLSLRSLAEAATPAPTARDITHTTPLEVVGAPRVRPTAVGPRPMRPAPPPVATVQLFRGSQSTLVAAPSAPGGAP